MSDSPSYCVRPFELLEVHEGGTAYPCCPAWISGSIGSIGNTSVDDVWNGEAARAMRRSILDGSFSQCNAAACPHVSSRSGPVGTMAELRSRNFDQEVLAAIEGNRDELPYGPLSVGLSYDRSCNLSCPSCRQEVIMNVGDARAAVEAIQDRIVHSGLRDARNLFISGSGDPFASPVFRSLLMTLGSDVVDRLHNIHLHTNALLWTPPMWDSLPAHTRAAISSAEISIDAATAETYELLRRGGQWETLLENLTYIGGLRASGELARVRISMVVQVQNFTEMADFIALRERFGFDECFFSVIDDWFPQDQDGRREYRHKAVHRRSHPRHGEFLRTIRGLRIGDGVLLGNLLPYRDPRNHPVIEPELLDHLDACDRDIDELEDIRRELMELNAHLHRKLAECIAGAEARAGANRNPNGGHGDADESTTHIRPIVRLWQRRRALRGM